MDLEVEVALGRALGCYLVYVASPAGEATGALQVDIDALLSRRPELQSTVLASAVTARRAVPEIERSIREVGEGLFSALFSAEVYGRYTACTAMARERGEPLRVVLRLQAPELAALPWETLFDREAGEYLCQSQPLVRHVQVASPTPPLAVRRPLRILGVIAAPRDLASLDTAGEQRRLADALAEPIGRGAIELAWTDGGRWADLQDALMGGPWHVVHFIGHGGYDTEGVLALVGPNGDADLVGAERFTRLLRTATPTPRLVVLNSCSSGQAGADDVFSSTGAALVRSGVTAVVAMQFAVSDVAASAFAGGFYAAIAHARSIGQAVQIGRIAIDGTGPHTLEWVTPVLYLRGDDIPLYTLDAAAEPTASGSGQPADLAARAASLQALYVQGLAELRLGHHDNAVSLFESVLALDPHYRDAAERRDKARLAQQAAVAYHRGQTAQEAGDWTTAAREYQNVLDADRAYLDAASRLKTCQSALEIADLQAELRLHAEAGDWEAVVASSDDIARLNAGAADPDGLATAARAHLEAPAKPVAPPPDLADRPSNGDGAAHRRSPVILKAAIAVVAVAVVVVLVVLLLGRRSSNTTTPPAASGSQPVAVTVPSTQIWTDTGIDLASGDKVSITATGTIMHNKADPASSVGPDGDPNPDLQKFNLVVNGVAVKGNHAGLIGKVNDGEPFVVGQAADFTASADGRLFLGVNDGGVDNNAGNFDASVAVTTP